MRKLGFFRLECRTAGREQSMCRNLSNRRLLESLARSMQLNCTGRSHGGLEGHPVSARKEGS